MSSSATNFGEMLQRARTARGLSIADAERALKIRAGYLAALEEERFDALPPRAYAKGFIRSYAGFLGIDPQPLLAIYEQIHPQPRESSGTPPVVDIPIEPAVAPSPLRRFLTYALVVVGVAVVALLYGFYAKISEFARSSPPPPAAATPAPDGGVGVPPEVPSGGPGIVPASPGPAAPGDGLVLALAIKERTWVRVVVDGEEAFSGVLDEGQVQTYQAKKRIELRLGNAGGVEVTLNGQPLGTLGRRGRVVDRTFRAAGDTEGDSPVGPAAKPAPDQAPAEPEPVERP